MLEIRGLRKKYGNFQALDGLDLEIPKGELFGFVGPNGAGKTTTLRLQRQHRPDKEGNNHHQHHGIQPQLLQLVSQFF